MKVWKSPVLYLGILLVVGVLGLLLAPFVIDWNSYRADLEAYGKKLTGRQVMVDGQVSARLFPWPRLTVENVKVANPEGMDDREFASAARITVHMTLARLLQGSIDVESVGIEEPVVNFERLESGENNWVLTPSADLVNSDILARVRLDKITLTGGTLNYRDWRRGETVRLDDINADVASPGVAGPLAHAGEGHLPGQASGPCGQHGRLCEGPALPVRRQGPAGRQRGKCLQLRWQLHGRACPGRRAGGPGPARRRQGRCRGPVAPAGLHRQGKGQLRPGRLHRHTACAG
jgi:hypothetical protein